MLAKLGDMSGHKRMLLLSTALTALASWALVLSGDFATFLIAWALQGCSVVWDLARRGHRGPLRGQRAGGAGAAVDLRRHPAELGYGLGLDAGGRSLVIGCYLLFLIAGALLFAALPRRADPGIVLVVAAFLVAAGYLLFLPPHSSVPEVLGDMLLVGLGGGALVAALPAAAASAAPRSQTGVATAADCVPRPCPDT